MNKDPDPFRRIFLRRVCGHDYALYLMFIVEAVFLVLVTLSFLLAELDEATRAILILDYVLLGTLLTGTLGTLFLCQRYINIIE